MLKYRFNSYYIFRRPVENSRGLVVVLPKKLLCCWGEDNDALIYFFIGFFKVFPYTPRALSQHLFVQARYRLSRVPRVS